MVQTKSITPGLVSGISQWDWPVLVSHSGHWDWSGLDTGICQDWSIILVVGIGLDWLGLASEIGFERDLKTQNRNHTPLVLSVALDKTLTQNKSITAFEMSLTNHPTDLLIKSTSFFLKGVCCNTICFPLHFCKHSVSLSGHRRLRRSRARLPLQLLASLSRLIMPLLWLPGKANYALSFGSR